MSTKECNKCEETLDIKANFKSRSNVCKTCERNPEYAVPCSVCGYEYCLFQMDGFKCIFCKKGNWRVCSECGQNLTTPNFRRNQPICKICESGGAVSQKTCKKCGVKKSSVDFRQNRGECTDCERSAGREYRRTTTKSREWAVANRDRMTELSKNWYEKNKSKIRETEQQRLKEDPIFKTIKYYRISVNRILRTKMNWSDRLKSSKEDFQNWLENCFGDEMTHKNYSVVWQVDHVLPLDLLYKRPEHKWCWSLFGSKATSEELLFSWYNTQPLTREQNRLKGNEITLKTVRSHLKTLEKFMKENDRKKTRTYYAYRKLLLSIVEYFYDKK